MPWKIMLLNIYRAKINIYIKLSVVLMKNISVRFINTIFCIKNS
ncbi:hypothetical protein CLOSBL3_12140 [Clostridiaceae bacterium BL-3]|nr:hypothetical protein CLOSBL3_12140 [Clostridiaceae bacterium BL-3]